MKKSIVLVLLLIFNLVTTWGVTANQSVTSFTHISGTYDTSAYSGSYPLADANPFPKRACVMRVHLDIHPDVYYEWQVVSGYGDETLQPDPDGNAAYIGQNGNTDVFVFRIIARDKTTNHELARRDISFYFIEGFTKPNYPSY